MRWSLTKKKMPGTSFTLPIVQETVRKGKSREVTTKDEYGAQCQLLRDVMALRARMQIWVLFWSLMYIHRRGKDNRLLPLFFLIKRAKHGMQCMMGIIIYPSEGGQQAWLSLKS